ncbi:MAG: hypothetical protein BGO96_06105 [Micrococcales bacterium 73-15]|uniref:GH92 family glycosyl hydrolase n=1 Tax=Salana multivorans TaxID=120377 RepID=UPI00095B5FD4|nr:GH92 family glycosyl hydrolase [Salana multivorans]OJX97471.1 MAG: hypothetical protein BGO96_06105 [Micrococcales bacterium 73-15]
MSTDLDPSAHPVQPFRASTPTLLDAGRRTVTIAEGAWPVTPSTRLSYRVRPELDDDLAVRPSTFVAVDAELDDGTLLSSLGARDHRGFALTPAGQGEAEVLYPRQWNHVECAVGAVAAGRTVVRLLGVLDPPDPAAGSTLGSAAGSRVAALLADVRLDPEPPARVGDDGRVAVEDVVDLVDTRRGTNAGPVFSRGNTIPAAAVPNGFTLVTPMTTWSCDWPYAWHDDPSTRPVLRGIALAHQPSPWMGDRDQLVLAPSWGAADDGLADDGLADDGPAAGTFSHDAEVARPHSYEVVLDSGARVTAVPSDHGALLRLAPPAAAGAGGTELRLELGTVDQDCSFQLDTATSTVRGWVDGGSRLSVGVSRMFVVARVEIPDGEPARGGVRDGGPGRAPGHRVVVVPGGGATVRVGTSFLSIAQAEHALDLELGDATPQEQAARVRAAWTERLGVLELAGARREELVSAYGGLYRVNLYPTAHHENVGTAEAPEHVHASPVLPAASASTDTETGATIRPGRAYVNHGFWDTYRTVWPLYALVYPDLAAELADGFVEMFRSAGWTSRWPSPGYADLMTGTSSDVAFADLAVKGVPLLDPVATYRAGLRNATALPPSPAVGRKDLREGAYRGFPSSALHEAVSWAVEAALNDAALAAQAELLAADADVPARDVERLRTEARYLRRRSLAYRAGFDAATGFFRSRDAGGALADGFDPLSWGGDYTETNAWSYAFPAPHDGAGLAALHGGPDGLGARLDEYLATPELADRPGSYDDVIHEMTEARDVRRGQLGLSNQPAHHIPFMYAFARRPGDASALVRDALRRLFGGSELGQGYPGDEDDGEMSAWYLWALTGLYPLQVGAPRYVLTAPGVPRVTWHLPGGDLVVSAEPGDAGDACDAGDAGDAGGAVGAEGRVAFDAATRIAVLRVDGRAHDASWLAHEAVASGAHLDVELTAAPSAWATGADAVPPSVEGWREGPWRDLARGGGTLTDDEVGRSVVALGPDGAGGVCEIDGADGAMVPELYTLTCGPDPTAAPRSWRCEASVDGAAWTVLDERLDEAFDWPWQLRPFAFGRPVPPGARWFRLVALTPGEVAQLQLLG